MSHVVSVPLSEVSLYLVNTAIKNIHASDSRRIMIHSDPKQLKHNLGRPKFHTIPRTGLVENR